MNKIQLKNFEKKFIKKSVDDCWEWLGAKNDCGYGYFGFNGKIVPAHRVSYIVYNQVDIQDKNEIDHKCRNRGCVNPNHLEQVTHKENNNRKIFNYKTTCINGHLLPTEKNEKGRRHCKICNQQRINKFRNKKGQVLNIDIEVSLQN